jgi:hypothetical protein
MAKKRDTGPLLTPFTITIDTREQCPYGFAGLVSDTREGCRPAGRPDRGGRGSVSGDYGRARVCRPDRG